MLSTCLVIKPEVFMSATVFILLENENYRRKKNYLHIQFVCLSLQDCVLFANGRQIILRHFGHITTDKLTLQGILQKKSMYTTVIATNN
jgi:hypothetical protein